MRCSSPTATEIAGIFTERDYLRRIAVEGRRSRDTLVRDVMSAPVICVTPETGVDESMALMSDRRIRHAPVVDGRRARRDDLDRRPRQVHLEAPELPDPVPDGLHRSALARATAAAPSAPRRRRAARGSHRSPSGTAKADLHGRPRRAALLQPSACASRSAATACAVVCAAGCPVSTSRNGSFSSE